MTIPNLPGSDDAWWPWPDKNLVYRHLGALWRYVVEQTEATSTAIERIKEEMTSAENAAYDRAREVVGLIRAEFESLRQQISDAAAAGSAALEDDAQRDADRLAGLVDELASVLPGEVPEVPVPGPGEPAELPDDGSTVVETNPTDESQL